MDLTFIGLLAESARVIKATFSQSKEMEFCLERGKVNCCKAVEWSVRHLFSYFNKVVFGLSESIDNLNHSLWFLVKRTVQSHFVNFAKLAKFGKVFLRLSFSYCCALNLQNLILINLILEY